MQNVEFSSLFLFKEADGSFDTIGNLYLIWKDDFLTWNQMPNAEYYSKYTVQFPARDIWFPPVQLQNSLSFDKKIRLEETNLVNIDQDGTISTILYVQLVSDCDLGFEMYATVIKFFSLKYAADYSDLARISVRKGDTLGGRPRRAQWA